MDIIQNILRKIASLSWPKESIGTFLNNKECANILLNENFLDGFCLRLSISKTLGYLMIFAACFYKLPVILKIFKAKGGDGLNIISIYLETSAYIAGFVYNLLRGNPISTYGDLAVAILQNFFIISLLWHWGIDKRSFNLTHKISIISIVIIFISIIIKLPQERYQYIATYSIIIVTISRLPQIISNFMYNKIGVQSIITLTNAVLGKR